MIVDFSVLGLLGIAARSRKNGFEKSTLFRASGKVLPL